MNQIAELFEFINQDEAQLKDRRDESAEIFAVMKKLIEAVADKKALSGRDLNTFGALVKSISGELELKQQAGKLSWEWKKNAFSVRHPVAKFIREAEDLLLNNDLSRIKRCAGEDCDLLFFDYSKNRSRRWCEMKHCGMLLKSKRYYDKHRKRNRVAHPLDRLARSTTPTPSRTIP